MTYISPRTAEIYDLGTSIAVFLQTGTFEAVKCVGDPLAAAHNALVLVVAEAALVADSDQGRGTNIRVAYGTFAVAFVA